ncbi:major facilitator superfamily domain-containing protein [Xylogone sp. PMI_703]|nr:major facilitator superfamily domain-containing protein [Xylogone sp. PMI_703]
MPPPQGKPEVVSWMSLPNKTQLFILAICRLSEPLCNTCLLPYLYYLVRSLQPSSTSAPEQNNGRSSSMSRQAGLLVAMFALSQFATSMPWAHVAEKWGRKTSILIGLALSIVSSIGFGFSKTIPALLFWRILAGIGNGNIGVMRTMTAEIVKERKYQSRAFLLLPLVFNAGNTLGLALGGFLAQPVKNLSWLFGPTGILNFAGGKDGVAWMVEYPFALPTIFNAWVLFCSFLLAFFGLKETLAQKAGRRDPGIEAGRVLKAIFDRIFRRRSSGYSALNADDTDETSFNLALQDASGSSSSPEPPKPRPGGPGRPPKRLSITDRSIYTREVVYTIILFALLPLHNAAFMQLFPVLLSMPSSSATDERSIFHFTGGLGLPSPTIGVFLSVFQVYGILIQLFIFPSLQARFGTLWTHRIAIAFFPLCYIFAPYLSFLPGDHTFIRNVCVGLILWLQVTGRTFGIPSSVILLTNAAPGPQALGAVHGVGNMMNALARAIGPIAGGIIFGAGIDNGVLGTVWWGYLLVVVIVELAWSWTVRGDKKERIPVTPIPADVEAAVVSTRQQHRLKDDDDNDVEIEKRK